MSLIFLSPLQRPKGESEPLIRIYDTPEDHMWSDSGSKLPDISLVIELSAISFGNKIGQGGGGIFTLILTTFYLQELYIEANIVESMLL